MNTLDAFLEMGGYAAFVWPSYGFALAAFVGILVITRRTLKAREAEFARLKQDRRGGA
jgi:heme exporter protein D